MRPYRTEGGWAVVRTVRDGCGERMRVLQVGGAFQSATYFGDRRFELPFEYMRAFDRLFDAERGGLRVRRMLAIGGGGCSYPKHVAATRPGTGAIEAVVDEVLAENPDKVDQYKGGKTGLVGFFVGELEEAGRLRLFVDDGVRFLQVADGRYEAIVVDAFDGAVMDGRFLDARTLAAAKERLAAGGLYVTNVVCDEGPCGAGRLQRAMESLGCAFARVHAVFATDEALSDRDNFVLVATDGGYSFDGSFGLA